MTLQRLSNTVRRHFTNSRLTVILVLAASIALCFSGCDNGCEQIRETYLLVSFNATKGYRLRSINGICSSGSHQYELKTITSFDDVEFELDPSDSIATLTLECTYEDYGDLFSAKETIVVTYKTQPTFLDLSCGCTMLYNITDAYIEEHQNPDDIKLFRHAIITNDEIRSESSTNINIEY